MTDRFGCNAEDEPADAGAEDDGPEGGGPADTVAPPEVGPNAAL